MNSDDFKNRLRKRDRHLSKWADRWPTNAYRVYDWDIPEWAFAVDRYADHVHLQHFVRRSDSAEEREEQIDAALDAVADALGVEADKIHLKERRRQKGGGQYQALDEEEKLWVQEGPHRFLVDLESHLDTGLFLDHREMRRIVAGEVTDRGGGEVANLFAYTGAFSVWAAGAGATIATIDLSNNYLDRAQENFRGNDLDPAVHRFEKSDVMRWIPQEHGRGGRFDLIVLDPPTFSRSKSMLRDLDIQRDHAELIRGCCALLNPGGALYFSTNFRDFTIDDQIAARFLVEEMTYRTVPEDFRDGIHRAWRITTR